MNAVRQLRLEKGWTVEELAEKASVLPRSVEKAEQQKEVNLEVADKLSAALGRCLFQVFTEPTLRSCRYCRRG